MQPLFQFIPVDHTNRKELADALMNDTATTSYVSKAKLKERILTDEKISGFIVRQPIEGLNEPITLGFSLDYDKKQITDMYTFAPGRGKELFQHIVKHYMTLGWDGEFIIDDNNKDMERFFKHARNSQKVAQ